MLSDADACRIAGQLWHRHVTDPSEMARYDRIYAYARGHLGLPDLPEGANDELKEIARLSVKNVLSLVEDTFAQNLSVIGYRTSASKTDVAAWQRWQGQRMDARQSEVHRSVLRYGLGYVCGIGRNGGLQFRPRTPRQMLAVYGDPLSDKWPVFSLETWLQYDPATGKRRRHGLLLDDTTGYPVDLGEVPVDVMQTETARGGIVRDRPATVTWASDGSVTKRGESFAHGARKCPVVRYVNARDAEDVVIGEVEPLIPLQQAINAVNFDRLVVSRFGAFPQRYVIGWTADAQTILKASMSRVWTFEDGKDTVAAGAFPAAAVEPYNSILEEMLQHVAMVAQVSPAQVSGKLVNLSAEALAAADASQQRKTKGMRDGLGEDHEQLLQLGAELGGDTEMPPDNAEVVWRDTEVRSFGAVVDGITKLVAAGVPLDLMLDSIPGWSQQQVETAKTRIAATGDVVGALQRLASAQLDPTPAPPLELT